GRERRGDPKGHPRILRTGVQRRQRGPEGLLGRTGSLPIALGPHGGRPHPSGHLPWRSPWATFPFLPLNSDRFRLRTLARCGVGASHFSANSAWCVSSWASRSSFNRSKSRSATLRVFLSSRAQARGNE